MDRLPRLGAALINFGFRDNSEHFTHPGGWILLIYSENAYRACVAVLFACSFAIAAYHRRQAARSKERLAREAEGYVLLVAIRLAGLLLLVTALMYLMVPDRAAWSRMRLPPAVRWAGVPIGAAALGLLVWTLHSLGTNLTDTVVTRRDHTLVTHGPYRWVRHPYYVVLLLLVTATSLLAARWTIAAAGVLVFLLLAWRTPREESYLLARFGEKYRDYMQRTPRYLPRPWRMGPKS